MRYRPLGESGIQVSEIGFGAWGIGGVTPGATSYGPTDDRVSRRALETAFDCGITFYDTANVYGAGRSESLIGETFHGRRDRVVIAIKVGARDYALQLDFSPAVVRDSVEKSLERLRTDYVDVTLLHSPDPASPGLADAFEGLLRLQETGKTRTFGVSLRSPVDGLDLLHRFPRAALQVNLNLLDQRAEHSGLLATAHTRNVGLIARTPLCFGLLADSADSEMTFGPEDHRSRWSRAQIRRWVEGGRMVAGAIAARHGQSLAQVALRYCLSAPGISTVVPGILTVEQARHNASASDLGPLAPDEIASITNTYRQNEFFVSDSARPHSLG